MGVFQQLGALVGKKTPKSVPKAPKVPKTSIGTQKVDIPNVSGAPQLDFGEKIRQKMYSPFLKEVEKITEEQERAFKELEKNIPAPVIREDSRETLSEEAIDKKLKELERQKAFSPDYLKMLNSQDWVENDKSNVFEIYKSRGKNMCRIPTQLKMFINRRNLMKLVQH